MNGKYISFYLMNGLPINNYYQNWRMMPFSARQQLDQSITQASSLTNAHYYLEIYLFIFFFGKISK